MNQRNHGHHIVNGCWFVTLIIVFLLTLVAAALVAIFRPDPNRVLAICAIVTLSASLIALIGANPVFKELREWTIKQIDNIITHLSNKVIRRASWAMISTIVLIIMVGGLIVAVAPLLPPPPIACKGGFCVQREADGEVAGISNGRAAFDLNADRKDSNYLNDKINIAATQQSEDSSVWERIQPQNQNSNDAETLIYQENSTIIQQPHITIIVATMLTGDKTSIGLGRSVLQGAYMAQKQANGCQQTSQCEVSAAKKVRLLIANIGGLSNFAEEVANKIIQFAPTDPTFAGVMGWPSSTQSTIRATENLAIHKIPMISPTATSEALNQTSSTPFFFRVCPSSSQQAQLAVQYAQDILHAKTPAIFYDPTLPYGDLGLQFGENFFAKSDISPQPYEYRYTRGNRQSLLDSLQNALKDHSNLDLIYFAGYSDDLSYLLKDQALTNIQSRHIHILGGSALYILSGYDTGTYKQLYFTATAYPDEWSYVTTSSTSLIDTYKQDYKTDFDGQNQNQDRGYGYVRSDGYSMLSYDATLVLLKASSIALNNNDNTILLTSVQAALAGIGSQTPSIQGVSGQISFSASNQPTTGNPIQKVVLMLCNNDGRAHVDEISGQFTTNGLLLPAGGHMSPQDCDPMKF